MHELEFRYQIASHFTCPSCGSHSATTELANLMGEQKKRLSKFEIFDMILTGCKSCGQLQFFDKYFLPEENLWGRS